MKFIQLIFFIINTTSINQFIFNFLLSFIKCIQFLMHLHYLFHLVFLFQCKVINSFLRIEDFILLFTQLFIF